MNHPLLCSCPGDANLQRLQKGRKMESFRPKKLKFEDYLSFLRDGYADNLTVSQLNQVLFIHGFVKLNHHTKEHVINAVSLLDLIPPTRSTICSNAGMAQLSLCHMSPLPLMELKQDMLEIEWQECPIGSVVTVNPSALCASDDSISAPCCLTVLPGEGGRGVDMVRKRIKQDEERDNMSLFSSSRLPKPAMESKERTIVKVKLEMEQASHVSSLSLKDADGYSWKNAGFKVLKSRPSYRMYYRCKMPSCIAKKYATSDPTDSMVCKVTYKGEHNHTIP